MKPIYSIAVLLLLGDEIVTLAVLFVLGGYAAYKLLEVAPHE